jgi:hypothetical protein
MVRTASQALLGRAVGLKTMRHLHKNTHTPFGSGRRCSTPSPEEIRSCRTPLNAYRSAFSVAVAFSNRAEPALASGIATQYTRSLGGIGEISFDSGCKWTGL